MANSTRAVLRSQQVSNSRMWRVAPRARVLRCRAWVPAREVARCDGAVQRRLLRHRGPRGHAEQRAMRGARDTLRQRPPPAPQTRPAPDRRARGASERRAQAAPARTVERTQQPHHRRQQLPACPASLHLARWARARWHKRPRGLVRDGVGLRCPHGRRAEPRVRANAPPCGRALDDHGGCALCVQGRTPRDRSALCDGVASNAM